jgi:alkaline phosphatase
MLNNDKGFFMMVEGGKIDWACHANDAGSTIHDTIALANAVQVAIDFAAEHPDETLILVTGDHETGGLSIGYAGTNYSTYLKNINSQTISYAKYDADYVAKYVESKTPFADAMKDVAALFGLVMPDQADTAANKTLVLTDYEVAELKKAYDITLKGGFGTDANGKSLQTAEEYIQYGTYTPFSVTVTHLLNNKSGINFSSYSHTGLPAAVYASGVGQELFVGGYDNTDIYYKLAQLLGIG